MWALSFVQQKGGCVRTIPWSCRKFSLWKIMESPWYEGITQLRVDKSVFMQWNHYLPLHKYQTFQDTFRIRIRWSDCSENDKNMIKQRIQNGLKYRTQTDFGWLMAFYFGMTFSFQMVKKKFFREKLFSLGKGWMSVLWMPGWSIEFMPIS